MKRINFTISGPRGTRLEGPIIMEDPANLPKILMEAVSTFLRAHGLDAALPITIRASVEDFPRGES